MNVRSDQPGDETLAPSACPLPPTEALGVPLAHASPPRLAPHDLDGAFWRLWVEHSPALRGVCIGLMKGNRADAEDALSHVMLKLREKFPAHQSGVMHERAWLVRFARNLCIDLQRKRRVRASLGERWGWHYHADVSPDDAVAFTREPIDNDEAHQRIRHAVERLPPRLRAPFVLRCLDRISYREVAARLSLSLECARKRVQEARHALRAEVLRGPVADLAPSPRPPGAERVAAGGLPAVRGPGSPIAHVRWLTVVAAGGGRVRRPVFLAVRPVRERQKLATLRNYVAAHPEGWKFRLKLASLLYQTGAWPDAIDACRELLRKRPGTLAAAMLLGTMLRQTGRRGEAAEVFAAARTAGLEASAVDHLTGLAAWMRGELEAAAAALQRAARHASAPSPILHALAELRIEQSRWLEAAQSIDAALALDRDDLAALTLGHPALVGLGQLAEAKQRARRVLERVPEDEVARERFAALTHGAV